MLSWGASYARTVLVLVMSKMTVQQAIQINAWLDHQTRRSADHMCVLCALQGLKRRCIDGKYIGYNVSVFKGLGAISRSRK